MACSSTKGFQKGSRIMTGVAVSIGLLQLNTKAKKRALQTHTLRCNSEVQPGVSSFQGDQHGLAILLLHEASHGVVPSTS